MKLKPNSTGDSQVSKVREASPAYPATLDLAPIGDDDALPDHDEPSIGQQLNHARLLLQLDPSTPDERLAERRKMMNPQRFSI
jgi:hypothetical protein